MAGYSKKDGIFIHRNTIKKKASNKINYVFGTGCKEEMAESHESKTLKQGVQEHSS